MPKNELNVANILWAAARTFIGEESCSTDHGHRDPVDFNVRSFFPRVLERYAVDCRDHVDPPGDDAHLVDEIVTREVFDVDLLKWSTKSRQGRVDKPSVARIVRDPHIKISGRSRLRMNRQRVSADEQKPNSAVDEFA